jgi:Ca-activated chloride channel family protein
LSIKDARGVQAIESPSHRITVDHAADGAWNATVVGPKTAGADELVVRYAVTEPPLTLHAAVHHDAGETPFFSATFATPPSPRDRTRAASDITLVLDRSGSMSGPSIESARAASSAIVERLLPDD